MRSVKTALPIFFALCFVFGLSYYLFSIYKPDVVAQVKGAKSVKEKRNYLDSIPVPEGSQEVGRVTRDGFAQATLSSLKSGSDVHKFFRGVLISKGWKVKDNSLDMLSANYSRDQERIDIVVLPPDTSGKTVFSISYND